MYDISYDNIVVLSIWSLVTFNLIQHGIPFWVETSKIHCRENALEKTGSTFSMLNVWSDKNDEKSIRSTETTLKGTESPEHLGKAGGLNFGLEALMRTDGVLKPKPEEAAESGGRKGKKEGKEKPEPQEKASSYAVGTRRKGRDGKMWEVLMTDNLLSLVKLLLFLNK